MLGPYRIVGTLGEGGMGVVYRAKDRRLARDVAIKVLSGVAFDDRERMVRFEQEARATGMLNHPNLLTIYDVGHAEGSPYLVSELLEGETLRERLTRGAIPSRKAVDLALQMAQGLAAAHDKGVVHRDLKPENIFITREGRVKILDFGIAKLTARAGAEGPTFQMAATEPGMVLGTVGYMSPEQVRGEPVDHRSDIFAFGAIVYEMLTGARAFKRSSSIETLSAILKEDPPDLTDSHPSVPPPLERLMRRCLEKDRELRFQTARDLSFNLETLLTLSVSGTLSQTPNPVATAQRGSLEPTQTLRPAPPALTPTTRTATPAAAAAPAQPIAAARPRTISVPKPKQRRVSSALLALLYIVSIAGAGFGGWVLARRMSAPAGEVTFKRITFRRGEVRGARFAPDGDTIVYSASWEGQPSEIFVANRQSPEARPLGIPDSEILSISKSTELAILLHRDRLSNLGTLARVPLAGGVPREISDNVLQAEWSPDGADLAVIRSVSGNYRIEYPSGRVKYETPHYIREVRFSPDGSKIAFIEPHGGENDIVILEGGRTTPIARGWGRGATGLAWRPDGQEIWITGTDTAAPPALHGVKLTGETRLIDRLTGSMKLYDISSAGRVLLSNGMWRAALELQTPGETIERDRAWFDWSILADLSSDGRTILFNETREGGGAKSAIYLRRLDAPVPVRIGDGFGDALSPDGKWVLAHDGAKLVVLPTGSGEPRELKVEGAFDVGAAWFADSRRVVVAGALPKHGYQLFVIDTLDESIKPITPEKIWGGTVRPFAVSPDSRFVAGMTDQEMIALYPADASSGPIAVTGPEKGEIPIQWSPDATSLYVYRPTALPARVFRITLATGTRELWKEFTPIDPAGVYKIAPVSMTSDGSSYAYNALRVLSELYVAEGMR